MFEMTSIVDASQPRRQGTFLSKIPSSGKIVGDEFGCIRIPGQIFFELPRDKVTINLNGRVGPKEINSFFKKKSSRKTSRLVVIYPCWLVFLALLCARGHACLQARWLAFPSELVQCEILLVTKDFFYRSYTKLLVER